MAQEHAKRFAQTRLAHRTELAEDYVEAILDLIEEDGHAKLTEIASHFGVAHPTVSKALKRLESDGFVTLRPYSSVQLTEQGMELALRCRKRHQIVVAFLLSLGLDSDTAEADAEGIEHHVSEKTLAAFASASNTRKGLNTP